MACCHAASSLPLRALSHRLNRHPYFAKPFCDLIQVAASRQPNTPWIIMSSAAQDELNALFDRQKVHSTSHPDDAVHSDSSEPSSDIEISQAQSSDEEEKSRFRRTSTMPSAVYHIPSSTHFDANTGPKGVIADAKSFDRARKRSFRQTIQAFSHNLSGSVFGEKQKAPSPRPRSREGSSSSEFSQDDDEADFMRTWRANRMTEMQSTTSRDHRTRRLSPSQRRYGHVVTVDPLGYLDAVDRVTAETIVVVLIYDSQVCLSSPSCVEVPCLPWCISQQ